MLVVPNGGIQGRAPGDRSPVKLADASRTEWRSRDGKHYRSYFSVKLADASRTEWRIAKLGKLLHAGVKLADASRTEWRIAGAIVGAIATAVKLADASRTEWRFAAVLADLATPQ